MMSPASMFSVAMIHLFRLPPARRAISADLSKGINKDQVYDVLIHTKRELNITGVQPRFKISLLPNVRSTMECSILRNINKIKNSSKQRKYYKIFFETVFLNIHFLIIEQLEDST